MKKIKLGSLFDGQAVFRWAVFWQALSRYGHRKSNRSPSG